jgi:hypothetical protein
MYLLSEMHYVFTMRGVSNTTTDTIVLANYVVVSAVQADEKEIGERRSANTLYILTNMTMIDASTFHLIPAFIIN